MESPPAEFVTTSDGYDIGYTVAGSGTPFVYFPNQFSHAQMYWTADTYLRPWLQGLASRFQTIVFDGRGQGISTRGLRETQTIEWLKRDLDAVLTKLRIEHFILMAQTHATHLAVRYATEHPDRVGALVLVACSPRLDAWSSSLYHVLPTENWRAFLLSQIGGNGPAELQAVLGRLEQTVTREDYPRRMQAYQGSDITNDLAKLVVPTLVLHPRNLVILPAEESMRVAARVSGARFVLIEGEGTPGDAVTGLAAIDSFIQAQDFNSKLETSDELLSARELDVLRLIARGRSNAQIAEERVISPNTVGRHVSNIFDKTGAANRTEAAGYARDHGVA